MKNTQALYLVKKLAAEMAEDGREDMAEALGISEKLLDKVISEEKQEYASTRKVNPPSARYPGDEPLHIPNRMARDCQYTLHDKYDDPKCIGCTHHRDNRPTTPKEDSHERTDTAK